MSETNQQAAYRAARAALGMYAGFFKDVVQEIGIEKALALHARQGVAMGAMMAAALREQSRDGAPDAKACASVSAAGNEEIGVVCETEESADAVKLKLFECPAYDAFRAAGLDHATVEAMCTGVGDAMHAELQKTYPQVAASFRFRTAAAEPCVEEFAVVR